jgi:hypothetical protein
MIPPGHDLLTKELPFDPTPCAMQQEPVHLALWLDNRAVLWANLMAESQGAVVYSREK